MKNHHTRENIAFCCAVACMAAVITVGMTRCTQKDSLATITKWAKDHIAEDCVVWAPEGISPIPVKDWPAPQYALKALEAYECEEQAQRHAVLSLRSGEKADSLKALHRENTGEYRTLRQTEASEHNLETDCYIRQARIHQEILGLHHDGKPAGEYLMASVKITTGKDSDGVAPEETVPTSEYIFLLDGKAGFVIAAYDMSDERNIRIRDQVENALSVTDQILEDYILGLKASIIDY